MLVISKSNSQKIYSNPQKFYSNFSFCILSPIFNSSIPKPQLHPQISIRITNNQKPISPFPTHKTIITLTVEIRNTIIFTENQTLVHSLIPGICLDFGKQSWMELFQNAKTVKLRSHHDKYLLADDDGETVCQDRHGGSKHARWTVEYVKSYEGAGLVRFMSCYGKYLTATDDDFLLGVTGKKVKQTTPRRLDSSIEWEPVRDGMLVKLKTRYGNFLRANGGLPPWRNSITHDVPSRSHTQDWILWEIEILQVYPKLKEPELDSEEYDPSSFRVSHSGDIEVGPSSVKEEGRIIHYDVVDDDGNIVGEADGERSLIFRGNGVQDLTQLLEEETGLTEITLCSRSPLNGKLYPMRLALPPNHVKLHVFVVPSSSNAAAEFGSS